MRLEIIREDILLGGLQLQMFTYAGRWHVRVVNLGATLFCGNYANEVDALVEYQSMSVDWSGWN
jgi:hypothetical protein